MYYSIYLVGHGLGCMALVEKNGPIRKVAANEENILCFFLDFCIAIVRE